MIEVILIGGEYHRERVKINKGQRSIRLALPSSMGAVTRFNHLTFNPEELKFVTYHKVASIFGEFGVIPENVFLEENFNPVNFLKNLVLDYVR